MKVVNKKLLVICLAILCLFGYSTSALAAGKAADTRPDYVIYVNRTQNCITIMEQKADGTSEVVKVMVCSCGRAGHETPEGTFTTSDYYDWRLMVDGTYGRYAVRFNNHILFHSVPYVKASPDTLEWDQYNLLGQNASLGCVRLAVCDVKWIHDNCKKGTQVVVYSGDEIVGGVTKPTALTIPADSPNRNWDPTDAATSGNPWFGSAQTVDTPTVTAPTVTAPTGSLATFNYTAYADRYADVKAAFGYNKKALYNHYLTYGIKEGRIAEFSGGTKAIFNYVAYADRYADVKAAFGYDKDALYNHYITYGIKEGRVAEFIGDQANFNYVAYADRYADLKAAFGYDKVALYKHYITYGIKEGREAEFE